MQSMSLLPHCIRLCLTFLVIAYGQLVQENGLLFHGLHGVQQEAHRLKGILSWQFSQLSSGGHLVLRQVAFMSLSLMTS